MAAESADEELMRRWMALQLTSDGHPLPAVEMAKISQEISRPSQPHYDITDGIASSSISGHDFQSPGETQMPQSLQISSSRDKEKPLPLPKSNGAEKDLVITNDQYGLKRSALESAFRLARGAVISEQKGDIENAIRFYCDAGSIFVSIGYGEKNSETRQIIQLKATELLLRAERLDEWSKGPESTRAGHNSQSFSHSQRERQLAEQEVRNQIAANDRRIQSLVQEKRQLEVGLREKNFRLPAAEEMMRMSGVAEGDSEVIDEREIQKRALINELHSIIGLPPIQLDRKHFLPLSETPAQLVEIEIDQKKQLDDMNDEIKALRMRLKTKSDELRQTSVQNTFAQITAQTRAKKAAQLEGSNMRRRLDQLTSLDSTTVTGGLSEDFSDVKTRAERLRERYQSSELGDSGQRSTLSPATLIVRNSDMDLRGTQQTPEKSSLAKHSFYAYEVAPIYCRSDLQCMTDSQVSGIPALEGLDAVRNISYYNHNSAQSGSGSSASTAQLCTAEQRMPIAISEKPFRPCGVERTGPVDAIDAQFSQLSGKVSARGDCMNNIHRSPESDYDRYIQENVFHHSSTYHSDFVPPFDSLCGSNRPEPLAQKSLHHTTGKARQQFALAPSSSHQANITSTPPLNPLASRDFVQTDSESEVEDDGNVIEL